MTDVEGDIDPRKIEMVLREARRIVRMHNGLIIAETAHGFVCANAGVDASNVSADAVVLLPDYPVPEGHTEMSWLRELTLRGAVRPYGTRDAETAPGAYVGHIFWFWLGRVHGVRLLDRFPRMKRSFGKGIRAFERYGAAKRAGQDCRSPLRRPWRRPASPSPTRAGTPS